MTLLSDKEILLLCQNNNMIEPFQTSSIKKRDGEKIISYGLSSYGADLSLADEFKVFYPKQTVKPEYGVYGSPSTTDTINGPHYIVDPKEEMSFTVTSGYGHVIIPPNSFALGRSNEYIKMPRDVTGLATNKSTYVRCGLNTPSTVLEAGWEGYLTIEMFNSTPHSIKVYANEGIVQILFFKGEGCLTSYADRSGKYMNQTGVTGAKL